jgi:hypothetical protein
MCIHAFVVLPLCVGVVGAFVVCQGTGSRLHAWTGVCMGTHRLYCSCVFSLIPPTC